MTLHLAQLHIPKHVKIISVEVKKCDLQKYDLQKVRKAYLSMYIVHCTMYNVHLYSRPLIKN